MAKQDKDPKDPDNGNGNGKPPKPPKPPKPKKEKEPNFSSANLQKDRDKKDKLKKDKATRALGMTAEKFIAKLKKKENKILDKKKYTTQILETNEGARYLLYINAYNKKDVGKAYYSTHNFLNDGIAVRGYKQFVRNFLLKKYRSITFTIEKPETKNGIVTPVVIGKFTEERSGASQRTIKFLHREYFQTA